MRDVEGVVEVRLRAAATPTALVECAVRSGFRACRYSRRALAFFGRDRNDAADGVGAVEAALRPAQHLDAFDIARSADGRNRRRRWDARIADVDAVDQHLDVVGVGPAHEDRGLAARPSRFARRQGRALFSARPAPCGICSRCRSLAGDHGHRTAELARRRRHRGRADEDGRQFDGIDLRVRRQREQSERQTRRRCSLRFVRMTSTFLRLRARRMAAHRVRPSPVRRTRSAARIQTTRDAHVCNVVRGVPSRLRTGIVVTAAKDRSVWTPRPPVG